MLYFSNFVTKHFSNNKDTFKAKCFTGNVDRNSDLVNTSAIIVCPQCKKLGAWVHPR